MKEPIVCAKYFLTDLSPEETSRLYNDLLSIKDVYLCNKDTCFYTFRKIRRAAKRHTECRKRTFEYQTSTKHHLVISQIHEQRLFKNHYRIEVTYDQQELGYDFIEDLLHLLHSKHFNYVDHILYT
ncbi:MAG: hypothetical protein IC227_05510 [Enterococcus lacertideformus]|uniref:Uncharacterized protein n=1 Tax=Enterococcus lacertideformus TaxID=2771493 RepID=A0A931AW20_9ENTE|nr:hypothetical protein [Enterococcus lacertideformus]